MKPTPGLTIDPTQPSLLGNNHALNRPAPAEVRSPLGAAECQRALINAYRRLCRRRHRNEPSIVGDPAASPPSTLCRPAFVTDTRAVNGAGGARVATNPCTENGVDRSGTGVTATASEQKTRREQRRSPARSGAVRTRSPAHWHCNDESNGTHKHRERVPRLSSRDSPTKPALNAFAIIFAYRFPAAKSY
jgi:hypothetical protein